MEEKIIKSHHHEISKESEKWVNKANLTQKSGTKMALRCSIQMPSEFRGNLGSNLDSITRQTTQQA